MDKTPTAAQRPQKGYAMDKSTTNVIQGQIPPLCDRSNFGNGYQEAQQYLVGAEF